jgi:DNA-binding transcriptional MerR regulator
VLTIGEFASRLSPKALRLYDELGLLRPAVVDPGNGYRRYAPEHLDRARLVAWLRRLGMPLAAIRTVVAPLAVDYAVRTDRGLVRDANQDFAYAGAQLFAVADGFGDHGAGASQAAVEALQQVAAGDLLNAMADAAQRTGDAVRGMAESGTTLTALIWSGSQLGLVHIGDSRAYLLRDDTFFQITHDDTLVQSLVDEGKLTEDEVAHRARRAVHTGPAGGRRPARRAGQRGGRAGQHQLRRRAPYPTMRAISLTAARNRSGVVAA